MGIKTKPKNRSPQKRKHTKQNSQPPINEALVRILSKNTPPNTNVQSIQVRVLIDSKERDAPPMIELTTLKEAISKSVNEGVDLVGINLNQDVPVLKCIDFNKFLYQQSKKNTRKTNGSGANGAGGGGKKATKQFTFKAGIDDNDLTRKATNMISYLLKGHACQVTITSKGRFLKEDKDVIVTTLGRLQEIVGEDGNIQGKIKKNEYGNRGSLLFQPNSKKNQQK